MVKSRMTASRRLRAQVKKYQPTRRTTQFAPRLRELNSGDAPWDPCCGNQSQSPSSLFFCFIRRCSSSTFVDYGWPAQLLGSASGRNCPNLFGSRCRHCLVNLSIRPRSTAVSCGVAGFFFLKFNPEDPLCGGLNVVCSLSEFFF